MQPYRYRVITSSNLADLEMEVNRLIDRGADLIGGITCVELRSGQVIWAQAVMCRY